ncbi:hypothetical protein AUC47_14660 [Microbacterium sp. SZ1]|uniref:hypothetical protein n=1 Tax=Microbacterium sp. SZ1 TaxID=1849736 RepID=UPI000BBB7A1E|nr:hypothetical protein [Microbacterium sp. SZ1]PCE15204.1 hypothetical protein AUC47_14660 [Microbacterium sp. SZ1]
MNTNDSQNTEQTPDRSLDYWLKAVDRLMAAQFDAAFADEHATRRDWRLLNVVDGTAPARRPLTGHKLHDLVHRGWIVADGDGWALTHEGRDAKDRLGALVDGIRATVTDAVSPEDLATTLSSLESIARALGWDEETPLPRGRTHGRGFGRRHGFGPRHGFGRPFGRRHDFDPRHGFDRDFGPDAEHGDRDCGHRGHDRARRMHGESEIAGHRYPGHPGARATRLAQHAFERGFDAGYTRGRDA